MKKEILSIILLMGLMHPIFAMQDLSSSEDYSNKGDYRTVVIASPGTSKKKAKKHPLLFAFISLVGISALVNNALTINFSSPKTAVTPLDYNLTLPANTDTCTYIHEPCNKVGLDLDECRIFCEQTNLGIDECFIKESCTKEGNKATLTTGSISTATGLFLWMAALLGWHKAR